MNNATVDLLFNDDKAQLYTLRRLFSRAFKVRVAMGFITSRGLELLGDAFAELVRSHRVELLGGARPRQLSPEAIAWFEQHGAREALKVTRPATGMFHAKTWLIESLDQAQTHVIIGSGNLTSYGLTHNTEVSLWSRCAPTADLPQRTLKWFEAVWTDAVVPEAGNYESETLVRDEEREAPLPTPSTSSPVDVSTQEVQAPTPAPHAPRLLTPPRGTSVSNATPAGDFSPPPPGGISRVGDGAFARRYRGWHTGIRTTPKFEPLFPYQMEAIEELRAHRLKHGDAVPAVLALPTGGGKTKTAVSWMIQDFVAKRQRVLWLAHRRELLDQVTHAFEQHVYALPGELQSPISRFDGDSKDASGDIVVASVQSVLSAPKMVFGRRAPFACVCFDEAHHATAPETRKMLEKVREQRGPGPMLGLTATPYRADRDEANFLNRFFGAKVAYRKTFGELVAAGYLAGPSWEFLDRISNRLRLAPHEVTAIKRNGDFTPDVLRRVAQDGDWNGSIIDRWASSPSKYGSTLVFASTIEHAVELKQRFEARQIRAAAIDYTLDADTRAKTIERFRRGELDVLVNVAILTEGTDIPGIRTVLLARPTLSAVLYLQMIGRAARRGDDGKKTSFTVLDCVNNALFHDLDELHSVTDEVRSEFAR